MSQMKGKIFGWLVSDVTCVIIVKWSRRERVNQIIPFLKHGKGKRYKEQETEVFHQTRFLTEWWELSLQINRFQNWWVCVSVFYAVSKQQHEIVLRRYFLLGKIVTVLKWILWYACSSLWLCCIKNIREKYLTLLFSPVFKVILIKKKNNTSFPQPPSPRLPAALRIMSLTGLCDKVIIDWSPPHVSQSFDLWLNIQSPAPKSTHSEHIYRHFEIIRC